MRAELAKQRSGRRRFRRTMQMVELAIAAGKDEIAQPLLEDIAAAIETHKLDAWEDPEQMANDLNNLMRYSKRIQASAQKNKSSLKGSAASTPSRRSTWGDDMARGAGETTITISVLDRFLIPSPRTGWKPSQPGAICAPAQELRASRFGVAPEHQAYR